MPTIPAARRLSPKVRRLLHEHDMDHRSLPGTGAGGRVTPRDVLGAAGLADVGAGGAVRASPLARRVLRRAGVDLAAAMRTNGGRRLTRADAANVVAASADTPRRRADPAPARADRTTPAVAERAVDVARLWSVVTATQPSFVGHNGFELDLVVPVARALVTVLRDRRELLATPARPGPGDGRPVRVHVGFVRDPSDPAAVATVADAQDLGVAGLARRARAATERDDVAGDGELVPTFVVAADVAAPADVVTATTGVGLLTVGPPSVRQVRAVDHLGHVVTHERPHRTIRLYHDDRLDPGAATELLRTLGNAVAGWTLPVGP